MPISPQHTSTEPTINDAALAIVAVAAARAKDLDRGTVFTIEDSTAVSRDKDIATYICVAIANTPNRVRRISSCNGVHMLEVQ